MEFEIEMQMSNLSAGGAATFISLHMYRFFRKKAKPTENIALEHTFWRPTLYDIDRPGRDGEEPGLQTKKEWQTAVKPTGASSTQLRIMTRRATRKTNGPLKGHPNTEKEMFFAMWIN